MTPVGDLHHSLSLSQPNRRDRASCPVERCLIRHADRLPVLRKPYSLTAEQLGRGRTLRCAQCRHTWFATPRGMRRRRRRTADWPCRRPERPQSAAAPEQAPPPRPILRSRRQRPESAASVRRVRCASGEAAATAVRPWHRRTPLQPLLALGLAVAQRKASWCRLRRRRRGSSPPSACPSTCAASTFDEVRSAAGAGKRPVRPGGRRRDPQCRPAARRRCRRCR